MKKKDTSKSTPLSLSGQSRIMDSIGVEQSEQFKDYFTFFENSPTAFLIVNFLEVKTQIEEFVKKSNSTLKNYISKNPKILAEIASKAFVKEGNKAALKLFKANSKDDLFGNISKILNKKSVDAYLQLVNSIFLGEKGTEIMADGKTLENQEIKVLMKVQNDHSSTLNLAQVIVSFQKISEIIEEPKKRSWLRSFVATKHFKIDDKKTKLLENTITSIKEGFIILDHNSNYIFVNKIAEKLLGKSAEELIGKHIWTEFPEKEGDLFFDNYYKAINTKQPITFENFYKPWQSWFENRIIPSEEGVLMFFHEITDQKLNENKIKEAYNIINKSSSVAFLCKNERDFPVIFASENSINLFGFDYKTLLTKSFKLHKLVHPDDLPYIRAKFFELSKSKTSLGFKPKPFRIITKNGEVKWIQTSVDALRNEKNEITHIQGISEDFTEQKKREDLFFKNNQRLKDQFNNTPLASIMWDLDFKILEWNNAAQRIFGYSAEEVLGKEGKDLLTPSHLISKMKEIRKNFLNQKEGYKNTNENLTKDGRIIVCDWYTVNLKDSEGNIIGTACLVDDISDRVQTEKLLEKSEKKYRDIFEKSVDAVLILKDGLFEDCNNSTLKMFGYANKQNLLKIHPSLISPETQPDGLNSFVKAEEMIKIALEKGSNRFKWYHKHKKGFIFPVEVSLTRIDESDSVATIHAVLKDISEQIKNETLEDVLYNISKAALTINNFNEFGLFIRNELQKIIETNNFFIAIYNEETDMISTPVFVDEKEEVEEFSAKNTLTGYVIKTKQSLIINANGHKKLIEKGEVALVGMEAKKWIGVPLKINDNVIGAIVVQSYENEDAYDENDVNLLEFVADQISTTILRKKAEVELNEALAKAQESDRLKSSFLANMSHEIRTPMNGIIGFSEFLVEPNLTDKERAKYANIIINSSKQLLTIVNDILDISKIESGLIKLNYESVNINKLLQGLYEFYQPKALENKLLLTCVKGLENFKSTIEIDSTKLNQVLTNLLSNAFKFTDKGKIEFGYQLKNEMLEFYVKDTGIGIEEKLMPVIFDRFIQANNELTKLHTGTGLGLSISKRLIELFNGKIWIDSNEKGTTIYFTIPYIKAKTPSISTVVIEQKNDFQVKEKELTILVAEDEEYNRMYINELFSKTNFIIIEAENGKKAIELAQKHPEINLILMDIKMPIMDGTQAMKEIKKKRPLLPIIALSAFAMESDKKTALGNGFDAYLTKPIDKNLLFNILNKYSN